MAHTFKDRKDIPMTLGRQLAQRRSERYSEIMRYAMSRYVRCSFHGDVEGSAKWFAAVDRASRLNRLYNGRTD